LGFCRYSYYVMSISATVSLSSKDYQLNLMCFKNLALKIYINNNSIYYLNCSVLGMHSNFCIILNKWALLKEALKEVSFFLLWTKKAPRISLLGDSGYYHIQATRPDTIGTGCIYIIYPGKFFSEFFIRIETFFRNTACVRVRACVRACEENLHFFLEFFIYVNSEIF